MTRRHVALLGLFVVGFLVVGGPVRANPVTIGFEGFGCATQLSNQYASQGVTFTLGRAGIISSSTPNCLSGAYPPHSGIALATNNWPTPAFPVVINFASLVTSVGAYFTTSGPLTIMAFDASGNLLTSLNSPFTENFIGSSSGVAPNQFLGVHALGIAQVQIAVNNGFFTFDDLTFTPVPEPGSLILVGTGLMGLAGALRRRFFS